VMSDPPFYAPNRIREYVRRGVTRFALMVIAAVVVCAACNTSPREQPSTQPRRNLDAEVQTLQLSQMCSSGADAFWRRNGYDHQSTPAKGTNETWGYQSHYNSEQKRCFVLVELVTQLPSGGSIQSQEIFDAIEGGQPLAMLHVNKLVETAASRTDLLKANAAIPATAENLDWFRGLMSK
jgi:hypothetical protein